MRRPSLLVATLLVLAGCADSELPTHADRAQPHAAQAGDAVGDIADAVPAALVAAAEGEGAIPGQYIVILRRGSNPRGAAAQLSRAHGGEVGHVYENAVHGLVLRNLPPQAVTALQRNPMVELVEQDQVVSLSATTVDAPSSAFASGTQSNATWGLDRVDQRSRPLDTKYSYTHSGAGVTAYIVDTGIRRSHSDFGGRAQQGFDAFGGSSDDCNGHGTHVAGTVGGTTYGVAKDVKLVAVRVLDCAGNGSWSGIIAGLDWVAANAARPAVANMSLGGGASASVDAAVNGVIAAGVPVVVAAGNGDWRGRAQNACNFSPARVPNAITVGATTSSDAKTSWSNYGSCVDLFAPGNGITSAYHTNNTATQSMSGTSMAAPHVAGAAALYLDANPSASPAAVASAIMDGSTKGIVTSSSTTNNHLLYTLYGSSLPDPEPPTDPEPPQPEPPAGDPFALQVRAYKEKGNKKADLSWTGTGAAPYRVLRDGQQIGTTSATAYHDPINTKGGGSATYRVCDSSNACSLNVSVNW